MALAANALTLLETAKTELGLSGTASDAVVERLINGASEAIERYCRRSFARATVTSERVKGYAGPRLLLERTPIVSVTSIIINGSTIDAAGYYIEKAEAGVLYRPAGWEWTAQTQVGSIIQEPSPGTEEGLYLVTYVGGYQTPAQGGTRTLPYDLEQACLECVTNFYRGRGKHQALETETEEGKAEPWTGASLTPGARKLLNPYRRIGT